MPESNQMSRVALVRDDSGEPALAIEVTHNDDVIATQLGALRGAHSVDLSLREVGHGVAEACKQIIATTRNELKDLMPDDLELSFGLTLAGEHKIPLIVKVSGEATIGVRATWHRGGSGQSESSEQRSTTQ